MTSTPVQNLNSLERSITQTQENHRAELAAIAHCRSGVSAWSWASIDASVNPDVVLVGVGDSPTVKVMAAAHILRSEMPDLCTRRRSGRNQQVAMEYAETRDLASITNHL